MAEENQLCRSPKTIMSPRPSSYPPPFRQVSQLVQPISESVDSAESDQLDSGADSGTIPVLDFQSLTNQVVLDNKEYSILKLGEACKEWGLFRLVNHGIPSTLLSQLQDHAKQLFSLPFETKQALFTSPLSYFCGTPALTPSGAALSIKGPQGQNTNWVEGLNVPLCQLSQIQAQQHPILNSFRYTTTSQI